MVTLIVNGQEVELIKDSIKITKQVNDIAELSSRQTDFTDSFSLKKTPKNTRILQQLGQVGDISKIPYSKVPSKLLDNGMPLINDGWFNVKETEKEYKVNIYDGLIDLFKAIENKNFGDYVDLSEINHNKDLPTIIASFTNEDYRYIINDYGGKTHLATGNKINIDYLVPSVRVKYLWNKIFSTFGFNYLGDIFTTSDFDGLWLTYPKGISEDSITNTVLYAEIDGWNGFEYTITNIISGVLNEIVYVVPENGNYKVNLLGSGNISFVDWSSIYFLGTFPLLFQGYLNGTPISTGENIMTLFAGDEIYIDFFTDPQYYGVDQKSNASGLSVDSQYMKFEKYDSIISFTEELKQLQITDFFKDILWRFGLTIFQDIDNNYIFKTFDERLQSGVIDWSEKYQKRTSETYTPKTYAQKNNFVQNYNDKEDYYNDGYFSLTNQNLAEKKYLLKSKIFSPEKDFVTFYINALKEEVFTPTLLWEKEVSENDDIQKVKYKTLSGRFYLLRQDTIIETAILKSDVLDLEQSVESLPVARFNTTTFKDFVPKYYDNIQLLLNDFRMHKIKLAISTLDFVNLNFDKLYYFEQEQNYYILNKLSYESGKVSDAEFYRVKYTEIPIVYTSFITNVDTNCVYFTLDINYNEPALTIRISIDNGITWINNTSGTTSPKCDFLFNVPTLIQLQNPFTLEIISNVYVYTI